MADLEPTEMLYGPRGEEPAVYLDSAAAPVVYTRYANHGPKTPAPYDPPPLPPYEPVPPPRHFLPPYDYAPQPPPSLAPRDPTLPPYDYMPQPPPSLAPRDQTVPPYDYMEQPPPSLAPRDQTLPPYDYMPQPPPSVAPRDRPVPPPQGRPMPPTNYPGGVATKPQPRPVLPPYDPPADMVIPGVQHPDGRFEPHPYFARRSPPAPPVEVEEPELPSKKTVEVAVPVCCEACKERITNYVGDTPGVDSVDCDVYEQKVTVTGDLAPAEVLQRCRKCFKKSTLV